MPEPRLSPRAEGRTVGERLLSAAGFLTSGEQFLRGISGGAIDIADAPAPIKFLADTFLSPVGLASTILAPVTGGTSLGLRGAAGVAAKLSTRLLPEVAVSAAATGAANLAQRALPEDAPAWARIGAGLGAGLVGGGGAAAGVRLAVRGVSPTVARGVVVAAAKERGLKWVPGHVNHEDLLPEIGRDIEGGPVGRTAAHVRAATGIDPSAAATGVERHYIALERQFGVNGSEVGVVLANASPSGFRAFGIDEQGIARGVNTPEPMHWNDLMEVKDAPTRFGMTPAQAREWTTLHEIKDDVDQLLLDAGIQRPLRELKEGEVHFPRRARSLAGEAFLRPSDPVEARMHESATVATKAGDPVLYDTPAGTMQGYVKAALDEIAIRQFETQVLASGASVPTAARATKQGAIAWYNLRDAGKAYGKAVDAASAARNAGALPEEMSGLQATVSEALEKVQAARVEWQQMKDKTWAKLPGTVVGRPTDELIDVRVWKGVEGRGTPAFMAADDVKKLDEWFRGRGIMVTNTPPIISGLQQAGDFMRFMRATADFSGPTIQGLPLFAQSPVAWGKLFANNIRSFFDPTVQGRYIQNNYSDIMDMIINGRVPAGEIELFKALERGGLGERVLRAPGLAGTLQPVFKRFQAAYDTSLLIARTELYKAMKPRFEGDAAQLGRTIRVMTGGLESRDLGVGPSQRALESMFLFAPKMLRSTLSMVGLAARPWTPEGGEVAHTLLRLMAAGAGIMAITNIATGMINDEPDEQIEKRLDAILNPLNGRQFLGVQVGDNWYGMGGQFRSVMQLVLRGVTDPEKLWTKDAFENPLIRYAQGRISPLANVGLGALEYATGEEHNLLPYETIDDLPDIGNLAFTGSLPFLFESLIENEGHIAAPLFEFFGGRTALATPKDALDAQSWREFGTEFNDLTHDEQETLRQANPKAVEKMKEFGSKTEKEYRLETERNDRVTGDLLLALNTEVKAGRMAPKDFRERVQSTLHDRYLRNETARRTLGINIEPGDSPKRRVLDAYFETFSMAGYTKEGGQVDWDKWEEQQAELELRIQSGEFGPPARAKQFLDERKKFRAPDELDWYFENKKLIDDAGYWDQAELALAAMQPILTQMGYDVATVNDLTDMYNQALQSGDPRARQIDRLLNAIQERAERLHMRMRRTIPGLETALYQNGHIERPRVRLVAGA